MNEEMDMEMTLNTKDYQYYDVREDVSKKKKWWKRRKRGLQL